MDFYKITNNKQKIKELNKLFKNLTLKQHLNTIIQYELSDDEYLNLLYFHISNNKFIIDITKNIKNINLNIMYIYYVLYNRNDLLRHIKHFKLYNFEHLKTNNISI